MKKSLLIAFVFCFSAATAQDTLLQSKRWQDYFADYNKEQYVNFEFEDYNKKFKYGEYYECLAVFKDSTQTPLLYKVQFKSIQDLCNPKSNLDGKDMRRAQAYSVSKSDLKYFVFHDLTFVIDNIVRKQYKVPFRPKSWSVLLIDGPIRYTKYFESSTLSSGAVSNIGVGRLQKYEEDLGSDPQYIGGFGFKKYATKAFSDYPELSAKIAAEEEGYKKKDAVKIIEEYNRWVLQKSQEEFKKTMMFGNLAGTIN
jgi:hypothetical protein